MARVRSDEVWQELRDDQRIRDMAGIIDADGMSRDAGWRYDLAFLAREIKRLANFQFNAVLDHPVAQHLLHHLIASKRLSRRGALFVIIGRLTFSAAQNTVTAIERETRAIFAGEPTGSRPNFIGERIDFELPYSKLRANAADLYWQTSWPDDHRPWIAPDIYAPPTFEAYRRNQDPAMDAILAIREHVPG